MANSIDRQTAVELLDNLIGMFDDSNGNDYDAALRLGIEALRTDVADTNVGDTISRQAAIDALLNELRCKPECYWDNGLNQYDIESVLKSLRGKAEAVQWIPVSERLPTYEEEVIVSVRDDSGDNTFDYSSFGWYACAGNFWIVDNDPNYHVIAWQPLPEPYKE